jgi:EpsI family protein
MIVMIGHLSGMELATGVDHLIYGWLFFGLVMFIMFWIGSYWREDTDVPATAAGPGAHGVAPEGAGRGMPVMAVCVVLAAALWPALALYGERANHNPRPVGLAGVPVSWAEAPAFADWKPDYMTPDATVQRTYQAGATPVALTLLYYRNQNREKSLISSINRLAAYKDAWHAVESNTRSETFAGHPLALRETILRKPDGNIMVWSWMWIGGHYTASDIAGKLWQASAKAMLRGDDGAAVMLSVPYDGSPETARSALRRFLAEQGPALDQALRAERAR